MFGLSLLASISVATIMPMKFCVGAFGLAELRLWEGGLLLRASSKVGAPWSRIHGLHLVEVDMESFYRICTFPFLLVGQSLCLRCSQR